MRGRMLAAHLSLVDVLHKASAAVPGAAAAAAAVRCIDAMG